MPPSAQLFRAIPLSGKSIALLFSASMHAAVALAAVRGAPHTSLNQNLQQDSAAEIVELELTPVEEPAPEMPALRSVPGAALARHHHDYAVSPDHDATAHDPSLRHVLPLTRAPNASPTPASVAAPAVAESPAATNPRFLMTVGVSRRPQLGTSVENGAPDAATPGAPAQPLAEALVQVPAKLLAGGPPSYTQEAEAAGIEADVPLEIVVDATGVVIGARALARVGYGLDEAALRSVRGYRFSPAQRAGKPQAVRMHWLMRFQLR
jgi:TonB family protein